MVRAFTILVLCASASLYAKDVNWRPAPGPDGQPTRGPEPAPPAPKPSPVAPPTRPSSVEVQWCPAGTAPRTEATQPWQPAEEPTRGLPKPVPAYLPDPKVIKGGQLDWHVEAVEPVPPEPDPVLFRIEQPHSAKGKGEQTRTQESRAQSSDGTGRQSLTITLRGSTEVPRTAPTVNSAPPRTSLFIVSPASATQPISPYNPNSK